MLTSCCDAAKDSVPDFLLFFLENFMIQLGHVWLDKSTLVKKRTILFSFPLFFVVALGTLVDQFINN